MNKKKNTGAIFDEETTSYNYLTLQKCFSNCSCTTLLHKETLSKNPSKKVAVNY